MKTTTVGVEQLRRELTDLLNRAGYAGEHFIVERHGTPLAVLAPYEEYMQRISTSSTTLLNGNHRRERPLEEILHSLSQTLEDEGITYEVLAEGMKRERIRTLKELYPEFWAIFGSQIEENGPSTEREMSEPVIAAVH